MGSVSGQLCRKGVVSCRLLYLAVTHRGVGTFGEGLRTRRWSLSPGALLSRICIFNQMESSCEIEIGSGFKIKGNKDFPGGSDGKAYNVVGPGYIPGSGRSFGEGNGNLHSVLLPGRSHGERSLVGYSAWGCKRVKHNLATKQQQSHHLMGKCTSTLGAYVL